MNIKKNLVLQDVVHIHGITNRQHSDDPTIILGADKTDTTHYAEHQFIVKQYKNHYIDYNLLLLKASKYIIFGCSIGETDISHFRVLFTQAEAKQFYIYYIDEVEVKHNIAKICDFERFMTCNAVKFINAAPYSVEPRAHYDGTTEGDKDRPLAYCAQKSRRD